MKKTIFASLLMMAVSLPLYAQEEIEAAPAQESTEQVAEDESQRRVDHIVDSAAEDRRGLLQQLVGGR